MGFKVQWLRACDFLAASASNCIRIESNWEAIERGLAMRIADNGLIVTAALLLGLASPGAIVQCQDTHGGMESVPSAPDSKTKVLAVVAPPVKLGAGAVTVTLAPAAATEATSLSAALKDLKPEERVFVVLRDLKATEPPGVLYDLYLDLPQGTHPKPEDPRIVGTLNFYNSVGVSAGNPGFFFSFDITSVAKSLQARNLLSGRTTITFVPSGNPAANAEAVVGRIQLVKQ